MFSGLMFKQAAPSYPAGSFVFQVKTDNAGTSTSTQFKYPTISGGSYNCTVYWGDGTTSTITTYNDAAWTHTYSSAGTYTIYITGTKTGIFFNGSGDRLKLLNISQWGTFNPGNSGNWFNGCANLTITATDAPSLTSVTTMNAAFQDTSSLTGIPGIGSWNVSSIGSFASCFSGSAFNSSINSWTISSATSMASMFQNNTSYNQSMSSWTLPSSLATMNAMLSGCTSFNSGIAWTFASTVDIRSLLAGCTSYNQNPFVWGGLSNITSFTDLLNGCSSYNQATTGINNATAVTTATRTFKDCVAFNQSLSAWSPTGVTNAASMLSGCTAFNSALPTFGTSLVTATSFLLNASSFNQSLSTINTTNVLSFSSFLEGATAFNHSSISSLKTGSSTNFTHMFRNASSLNQSLTSGGSGTWQTGLASIFTGMFEGASSFNQSLSSWDVTFGSDFNNMFKNATSFNQNLNAWTASSVTTAAGMFDGVTLSTANYNALLDMWYANVGNTDVVFSGGNSKYDSTSGGYDGATARADLIASWTWTITDGGHA